MNIELPRSRLDLASAIAEGYASFLMVLVHMTGDQRWLEPPYKPKRDVKSGRVFSAMPWRFVDYWAMTHAADLDRYV